MFTITGSPIGEGTAYVGDYVPADTVPAESKHLVADTENTSIQIKVEDIINPTRVKNPYEHSPSDEGPYLEKLEQQYGVAGKSSNTAVFSDVNSSYYAARFPNMADDLKYTSHPDHERLIVITTTLLGSDLRNYTTGQNTAKGVKATLDALNATSESYKKETGANYSEAAISKILQNLKGAYSTDGDTNLNIAIDGAVMTLVSLREPVAAMKLIEKLDDIKPGLKNGCVSRLFNSGYNEGKSGWEVMKDALPPSEHQEMDQIFVEMTDPEPTDPNTKEARESALQRLRDKATNEAQQKWDYSVLRRNLPEAALNMAQASLDTPPANDPEGTTINRIKGEVEKEAVRNAEAETINVITRGLAEVIHPEAPEVIMKKNRAEKLRTGESILTSSINYASNVDYSNPKNIGEMINGDINIGHVFEIIKDPEKLVRFSEQLSVSIPDNARRTEAALAVSEKIVAAVKYLGVVAQRGNLKAVVEKELNISLSEEHLKKILANCEHLIQGGPPQGDPNHIPGTVFDQIASVIDTFVPKLDVLNNGYQQIVADKRIQISRRIITEAETAQQSALREQTELIHQAGEAHRIKIKEARDARDKAERSLSEKKKSPPGWAAKREEKARFKEDLARLTLEYSNSQEMLTQTGLIDTSTPNSAEMIKAKTKADFSEKLATALSKN